MSTKSSRKAGSSVKGVEVSQAVEVTAGDRESEPGRNLGGTGAPPTNRAPDNSNPYFFQPLRWGVDSLYLSYPGKLSTSVDAVLRELKVLAQSREDLAAKAQYPIGNHIFEVKDKGSGLFPFTLEDGSFQIRLAAHHAKSLPMAYVKVSSDYLAHKAPQEAEAVLRTLLHTLGDVQAPKVSRIDLFCDFASSVDMESWDRHAWVTRARTISQYADGKAFTGWAIGMGSILMARLYNKQIEIQASGKLYLESLWRQAGWDGEHPVWRLEFEFKREVLDQLGLSGLLGVLHHRNGLWDYATTDWLKLTMPNPADKTRSRWPVHPLWMDVSSIDWESPGGPLLRQYTPSRAPSKVSIGQRGLSLLASIGALESVAGFDQALQVLGDLAYAELSQQAHFKGLQHVNYFLERIEILNRRYNTVVNAPLPDDDQEDPDAKEYRRQTKGY